MDLKLTSKRTTEYFFENLQIFVGTGLNYYTFKLITIDFGKVHAHPD